MSKSSRLGPQELGPNTGENVLEIGPKGWGLTSPCQLCYHYNYLSIGQKSSRDNICQLMVYKKPIELGAMQESIGNTQTSISEITIESSDFHPVNNNWLISLENEIILLQDSWWLTEQLVLQQLVLHVLCTLCKNHDKFIHCTLRRSDLSWSFIFPMTTAFVFIMRLYKL